MKILIIDDVKTSVMATKLLFEVWGHETSIADNARKAFDFLTEHHKSLDVVFIDYELNFPDFETAPIIGEKIAELYPDITLFVLTAFDSTDFIVRALQSQVFSDYLSKDADDELKKMSLQRAEKIVKLKKERALAELRANTAEEKNKQRIADNNEKTKSKIKDYHFLPIKLRLDMIESAICFYDIEHLGEDTDILQDRVVAGVKLIEDEIGVNWKKYNAKGLSRNMEKRKEMEHIFQRLADFKFNNKTHGIKFSNILNKLKNNNNPLSVFFTVYETDESFRENALVTKKILIDYPEKWPYARAHYKPIKDIINKASW